MKFRMYIVGRDSSERTLSATNLGVAVKRFISGWQEKDGNTTTSGGGEKFSIKKNESMTIDVRRLE